MESEKELKCVDFALSAVVILKKGMHMTLVQLV